MNVDAAELILETLSRLEEIERRDPVEGGELADEARELLFEIEMYLRGEFAAEKEPPYA